MKARLLIAAAFSVALGTHAVAAPMVSVVDYSTQKVGNNAHEYGAGFTNYLNPSWSWFGGDPVVVPPPANSSAYQSPFNNTPASDNTPYFSVGATGDDGEGSSANPTVLNFGTALEKFRILWGSIDDYNTLEFFSEADGGGTSLGVFEGTDIINAIIGEGGTDGDGPANFEMVALLTFTGLAGVASVAFSSTQAAFEFALAPVPIPPALLLFGTALAGMGLLSRRRRQTAA